MDVSSTIPFLPGLAIAASGIACGSVVFSTFYTLICMCSGGFPEWSGQAVPRNDVQVVDF